MQHPGAISGWMDGNPWGGVMYRAPYGSNKGMKDGKYFTQSETIRY